MSANASQPLGGANYTAYSRQAIVLWYRTPNMHGEELCKQTYLRSQDRGIGCLWSVVSPFCSLCNAQSCRLQNVHWRKEVGKGNAGQRGCALSLFPYLSGKTYQNISTGAVQTEARGDIGGSRLMIDSWDPLVSLPCFPCRTKPHLYHHWKNTGQALWGETVFSLCGTSQCFFCRKWQSDPGYGRLDFPSIYSC